MENLGRMPSNKLFVSQRNHVKFYSHNFFLIQDCLEGGHFTLSISYFAFNGIL